MAIAFYNEGCILASQNKYEEALIKFKSCLELRPNFAKGWFNKALSEEKLGKLKNALKSYERVIDIEEDAAINAWFKKSVILTYLDENDKALESINKVIELDTNNFTAYSNKAVILQRLGKYDEAIDNFKTALDINQNYLWASYNLACVYSLMNKTQEAIEVLKKMLKNIQKEDELIFYHKKINDEPDFDNLRENPSFIELTN